MRNRTMIGGIILIILGAFFLLKQLNVPLIEQISSWQLILIGIGLFFVVIAITDRKRDGAIFPGVILLGLGIHYLGLELWSSWPTHWAVFTFIVSLAFFAQFLIARNKGSLTPAFILLAVTLFSTVWNDFLHEIPWPYVWPILLIGVGIIMMFRGRR